MIKIKNGDKIHTIYGDDAVVMNVGTDEYELTVLDREIQIGFYADNVPHRNKFIETADLYNIVELLDNGKEIIKCR